MRLRAELRPFVQTFDSCILGSYAVALASRVGTPEDFFDSYCQHFNLPVQGTSEGAYVTHFQGLITSRLGFDVIRELHEESLAPAFAAARRVAHVTHIRKLGTNEVSCIEDFLAGHDAVACVSVRGGVHTNCVGTDNLGPWLVETSPCWAVGSRALGLTGLGKLVDALVVSFEP